MSWRRECSAKQPGGPDFPQGPGPPYTIRTPQQGGSRHPAWGVRGRHVSVGAGARARLPSFLGKTCPPTASMREMLSALCHSRARGDFCQAVLLIAHYQGAQCSRWRHPRHARQSAMPDRHDSTVYATTYTASTDTSPMGQVKTPLGQRVYRAMKHIRQEIHKALLMSFSWYTIHPRWTHLSGSNTCVRVSLAL